jgi:transcriptional regulator with XRE-family HTH domain
LNILQRRVNLLALFRIFNAFPVTDAAMSEDNGLGVALRTLRKERRMSLTEVADGARLSASFLSLVETGKSDITIGRLTRLVEFYGISIAELLPTSPPADPDVIRHDEMRLVHSPAEGIDLYLLAADTARTMMPMFLRFEPGARLAEYGRHAGEEWIYVLRGELELELEGARPRTLRRGDSAYYRADRPHLFRNASTDQPLMLVCVDSPPNL